MAEKKKPKHRTEQLQQALTQAVSVSDIKRIAKALTEKAIEGDIRAAEIIMNRLFGRPKVTDGQSPPGQVTNIQLNLDDRRSEALEILKRIRDRKPSAAIEVSDDEKSGG